MNPLRFLFVLASASGCLTEGHVARSIDAANRCEVAEDCVDVGSACPFGCAIYVHRAEAEQIRAELERWGRSRGTCAYDCAPVSGVVCEARRCVPQLAQ